MNSKWSYDPETPKLGQNLFWPLWPWSLTLTFSMDITSVDGNYLLKISWWYDYGNIVKMVWQTDWIIHRAAWSQLKRIEHLFYATSSFVYYFKAISEFKLELQSGKGTSSMLLLFQTLTLKLQGQGHGCGQRAKSYSQPCILLISFLFVSHQSNQ